MYASLTYVGITDQLILDGCSSGLGDPCLDLLEPNMFTLAPLPPPPLMEESGLSGATKAAIVLSIVAAIPLAILAYWIHHRCAKRTAIHYGSLEDVDKQDLDDEKEDEVS